MSNSSLEDLEVWKKARQLKKDTCQRVKTFPPEEKYGLCDQLIRSSRWVNTQIAEVNGWQTFPDRIRFGVIARGSLCQTLNHLIDAFDSEYNNEEKLNECRIKINKVEKILNGYVAYLERQLKLNAG
jgi:four helix bundle protein